MAPTDARASCCGVISHRLIHEELTRNWGCGLMLANLLSYYFYDAALAHVRCLVGLQGRWAVFDDVP